MKNRSNQLHSRHCHSASIYVQQFYFYFFSSEVICRRDCYP